MLVGWGTATAQEVAPLRLDPALQITQYVHDVWQAKDGLPQNSVYAVTQTRDGYLWLGTQEGLVRFDGVRFTVMTRAQGLESNEVRALLEDRTGALWIGTNGGGVSRMVDGVITTYTVADGLPGNAVRALYEDDRGHLWIGTIGGGLVRYDGASFTTYTMADGLTGDVVLALDEGPDGSLWIGTEAGLTRFRNGRFSRFDDPKQLPGLVVKAVAVGAHGEVWVGTNRGLVRREATRWTTYTMADGLPSDDISALYEDDRGTLWVGTLDGGVGRLYEDRFDVFSVAEGLTHNRVRAFFEDREGSLWIGIELGGLNRLRPGAFVPYTTAEGLSNDVVMTVLQDRKGAFWIGTDGGGVNRFQDGTFTYFTTADGLPDDPVSALYEDQAGALWVGTNGGGLCRLQGERFTCLTTADGLSSNYIYAIYQDQAGALWMGTEAGLNRLYDGAVTHYTTADGLPHDLVTVLYEDRRGRLWVGTMGGGLGRLQDGQLTSYTEEDGLASNVILAVHVDARGALWIGTQGGGLCRWQDEAVACLTTEEGLHNDNVLQILEDEQGYLWLGSMQGLSRVHREALEAAMTGDGDLLATAVYGTADGMKSADLMGGTQPAAWAARDGRLWFATLRGVATIDPAGLQTNPVPPPVRLEHLLVDGEPMAPGADLTLPPESRDVAFRYTGLSLVAPERVQFRYRLEPYDQEWVEAGTRREAYYTNLSPGRYRFHVIASNNDGVWNEQGTTTTFYVQPFFYETAWFYWLCAAGLILLGTAAYRLRTRHMKRRALALQGLVDARTRELRARERELEELNQNLAAEVRRQIDLIMEERSRYEHELIGAKEKAEESARLKATILDNISHEIRTPITAILGFAQILATELDAAQQEFVTYIEENGQRLLGTLNAILDLSNMETDTLPMELERVDLEVAAQHATDLFQLMAARKGLTLRTDVKETASASVDRAAIDQILTNLVGNAIKFTEEGEVVVEVGVAAHRAYCRVRDTGIGIGAAFMPHLFEAFKQESTGLARSHEGSGLGLAITRRLVEAMQGTISVESEKGHGAVFTVSFPEVAAEGRIAPAA